jgi:hypothetical protein
MLTARPRLRVQLSDPGAEVRRVGHLRGVAALLVTADHAARRTLTLGLTAGVVLAAALAYVYDGIILGLGDYTAMRRVMIWVILAFAPLAALALRFHSAAGWERESESLSCAL